MGIYKHIREMWTKPKKNLGDAYKQRLIKWRKEQVTVKVARPVRLDRARSVGYKAKPGFVVLRQRVSRGGHSRPQIRSGRRPKHFHHYLALRKSYQLIAEERAQKKHKNLVILNSYLLAKDGKHAWYEIIMIDPENPSIKKDSKLNWATKDKHKSRVFQGKTRAGKTVRGMRKRGKGTEKARPSRRANKRLQ